MVALAARACTVEPLVPEPDWLLSVTLPRPAEECYALFCDIERLPEWLAVIRSAVVTRRDLDDRPRQVSFLARLERATVGYTCTYRYRHSDLAVSWSTPAGSGIRVEGYARFVPLGESACLMTYSLVLDLGESGLPGWADPFFEAHAASATLNDFRDFATRELPG